VERVDSQCLVLVNTGDSLKEAGEMICKLNHLEEAFQKNFENSNVTIFEIIYLVMVVHRSD